MSREPPTFLRSVIQYMYSVEYNHILHTISLCCLRLIYIPLSVVITPINNQVFAVQESGAMLFQIASSLPNGFTYALSTIHCLTAGAIMYGFLRSSTTGATNLA